MEEQKLNGNNDSISKKDKRRQQITLKLHKMNESFIYDKDNYYTSMLHNLQDQLSSIQNNTNEYLESRRKDYEEQRDYELTRLRLWEEYQVKRIDTEYKYEINNAKEEYDKMIKLVKEKLYENLQKKIKLLKEDKLLLNLVNSNSYNVSTNNGSMSYSNSNLNLYDRRSLRKREFHHNTRGNTETQDEFSDSASGYTSATKKRRNFYNQNTNRGSAPAEEDSLISDNDYDSLNNLIFGEKQEKPNTRHSNKAFTGLSGLKNEEINEDLTLLRNATKKERK